METKNFKESKSETKLLVIFLCVVVMLSQGSLVGSRPYSITERHWTNPSWGRTSDWTKFRLRGCLSETVGGDRRVEREKKTSTWKITNSEQVCRDSNHRSAKQLWIETHLQKGTERGESIKYRRKNQRLLTCNHGKWIHRVRRVDKRCYTKTQRYPVTPYVCVMSVFTAVHILTESFTWFL